MRNYYTTYAMHCLRIYLRIPRENLTSDAHRKNWDAAEVVYLSLNDFQKSVIKYCFERSSKSPEQLAHDFAESKKISYESVQKVIATVCKLLAKERGLI